MASNRRIGSETSETRKLLLQAAAELMRDEGYAQVTSRKLAQKAGLKPQLVHYYFRTMSELFAEMFREATEQYLQILAEIAQSDDPLVRMFEISCDVRTAGMQLEFLALANHRKDMQAMIAEFGGRLNEAEAGIVRNVMAREGISLPNASAEDLATIIQTAARGLGFAGRFNPERYEQARQTVISWLRMLSSGQISGQP